MQIICQAVCIHRVDRCAAEGNFWLLSFNYRMTQTTPTGNFSKEKNKYGTLREKFCDEVGLSGVKIACGVSVSTLRR